MKTDDEKRTVMLTVRIRQSLDERIEAEAKAQGVAKSAIVRRVLVGHFGAHSGHHGG